MGRGAHLTFCITDMTLPAALGKGDLLLAFGIASALFFSSVGGTVRTLDALDIIIRRLLFRTDRHAAGTT